MRTTKWLGPAVILLFAGFCGCKDAAPEKSKSSNPPTEKPSAEDSIKANLAKLDPADRKLAEAQVFCAIDDENRLGSMGMPIKVMVKDQPVFVCCKSCRKQALDHPDKTLAKVEELKKKSASP